MFYDELSRTAADGAFSSAELQLILLALLKDRPAHGHALTRAIEARWRGAHVPTPGAIYPALTYLREIGRVTIELADPGMLYRLADAGREHLNTHRATADIVAQRP